MSYLDHCIFNWKETRAKFHDALINKYRERIRALMVGDSWNAQKADNTIEIIDDEEEEVEDEVRGPRDPSHGTDL